MFLLVPAYPGCPGQTAVKRLLLLSVKGVNSLPKTVTRQRRGCDLNPGPTAPESSTLTTRIPSHPACYICLSSLTDGAGNLVFWGCLCVGRRS